MKNTIHVLREWNKQIDCCYKLDLDEAKKIYLKMLECNGTEKEIYRNSLINGMLYLIPKFISITILPYLKNNSYDMNDIISVCNEELIKFVDSGKLLQINSFKDIFRDDYYKKISYHLVSKYDFYNYLDVNAGFFVNVLTWFINEKNSNKSVNYDDFLIYLNDYLDKYGEKIYDVFPCKNPIDVYNILNRIYLCFKNNDYYYKDVSLRQIKLLKNIIMDCVLSDGNYNDVGTYDFESVYMKKELEKQILYMIFNNLKLKDKEMSILKCRYGLDDGYVKTSKATGDIYGMTRAGADISVKRTIKRIRKKGRDILPLLKIYFEE